VKINKKISIPSSLERVREAVDTILGHLDKTGLDESTTFDIKLSLEEAVINAMKYGNRLKEDLVVDIELTHNGSKVVIAVEDKGDGFDHRSLPDPTDEENLLKTGGRGVFLIRHLMDRVQYNDKGNRTTMTKYIKRK